MVPNMSVNGMIRAVPYGRLLWSACLILLVGNIGFYFFFSKSWASRVSELQTIYGQKRAIRAIASDDAAAGYLKAGEDIRTFMEGVPEKATFTDRVRELNDILDSHGLSVEKMTFKPSSVEILPLSKYTTHFKVASTYSRLKGLLADIQEAPGLFCIEELSVENQSNGGETVVLSLGIATYFR